MTVGGGGGPAAFEASTALATAGREGWEEEGGRQWGGEGGGNPMRQRGERQREGNASQHSESLYLHPSLSLSFSPRFCP